MRSNIVYYLILSALVAQPPSLRAGGWDARPLHARSGAPSALTRFAPPGPGQEQKSGEQNKDAAPTDKQKEAEQKNPPEDPNKPGGEASQKKATSNEANAEEAKKKPPIIPTKPGGPRKGSHELGKGDLAGGESLSGEGMRSVASGQKMKIKGVVTRRDADTFVVQDANGVSTTVMLTNATSVKTKGGFLRAGDNYGVTAILRGLNLEVEGRGDGSTLVADKVRFNESDLMTARTVEANVTPAEHRVGAAEESIEVLEAKSRRLSGQLDELAAISNAARGGAKAAQETADAAIGGVNATNERISALDDYAVQEGVSVFFRVGSAVLSRESKAQLDEVARQALQAKGYVLEVSGFASADGATEANRRLSQRRADAVIRYLVENHQIPLRRIITPYGYGELQPVAENNTREGREQNRRVEVKVLVNRGIIQEAPTVNTPSPDNPRP